MRKFQECLGYQFNNRELLHQALTHSSYANENNCECNERLEFLGDSVLGLTVSRYLFENMSNVNEGKLSKIRASLVCEESLADVAKELDLGRVLRLGHGEDRQGGRERNSILSDALEAVFAAVYLDSGFDAAEKIILSVMAEKLKHGVKGDFYRDYKTALQEHMQKDHKKVTYKLIREEGPDHKKVFVVSAMSDDAVLAEGSGNTKKEAEQAAAERALDALGGAK